MSSGWKIELLGDVCELYQPKTISQEEMIDNGEFLVYGANGIIGRYNKYNHEKAQLLVTCRGATCGTINVSRPYSWITGNSMVVNPKDDNVFVDYMKYFLLQRNIMTQIITGAAQPQITRANLSTLKVKYPISVSKQQEIVAVLDKTSELLSMRKHQLAELDTLVESIFYDMFGEPVKNEKGWDVKLLKSISTVITGNTPSREISDFYNSNYIEWIKSDNIFDNLLFPTQAREYLSREGAVKGRCIDVGSVLVTCIAGSIKSIGTSCITDRRIAFNQQINAIVPMTNKANSMFFLFLIKYSKKYIQNAATNGMKHIITKSKLENLFFPLPPLELQNQFAQIVERIEKQKEQVRNAINESEDLFQKLMQDLFK